MNTKGRKLFRGVLGALAAVVLMGVAYTTTVMASSIGMIDTADLLDIHAEADGGSEVVGQVMDEGHVAILAKGDGRDPCGGACGRGGILCDFAEGL